MSSIFFASILLSRSILHTPWSRVLLGKLSGSQLVKTFPAFYGTRCFITVVTRAANCPYTETDQSSPCLPIPPLADEVAVYIIIINQRLQNSVLLDCIACTWNLQLVLPSFTWCRYLFFHQSVYSLLVASIHSFHVVEKISYSTVFLGCWIYLVLVRFPSSSSPILCNSC